MAPGVICDGGLRQVSRYNMDGTLRMRETLAQGGIGCRELLAEVQAAFILFLVAASFPALEYVSRS